MTITVYEYQTYNMTKGQLPLSGLALSGLVYSLTFCISNSPLNDMVHDRNSLFTGRLSKTHQTLWVIIQQPAV